MNIIFNSVYNKTSTKCSVTEIYTKYRASYCYLSSSTFLLQLFTLHWTSVWKFSLFEIQEIDLRTMVHKRAGLCQVWNQYPKEFQCSGLNIFEDIYKTCRWMFTRAGITSLRISLTLATILTSNTKVTSVTWETWMHRRKCLETYQHGQQPRAMNFSLVFVNKSPSYFERIIFSPGCGQNGCSMFSRNSVHEKFEGELGNSWHFETIIVCKLVSMLEQTNSNTISTEILTVAERVRQFWK